MHVRKFVDGINPEVRKDLREKKFVFTAENHLFDIAVMVPAYVMEKLKSTDWDKVIMSVKERATQYMWNWQAQGCPLDLLAEVDGLTAQFLRQRIYDQFADRQIEAGNQAWEVPETLQQHTIH